MSNTKTATGMVRTVLEEAKEFNLATALDTLDEVVIKAIAQHIGNMEQHQKRSREYICKEVTRDVAGFLDGRRDWTPGCVTYLEYNVRGRYGIITAASPQYQLDEE